MTLAFIAFTALAQDPILSLERIYSGEFRQHYEESIQWIDGGDSYVIVERSEEGTQLMKYASGQRAEDLENNRICNIVCENQGHYIEWYEFTISR